MKNLKEFLAVALVFAGLTVACTVPSWVTTVENDAAIAVPIVGSIVTVIDPAVAPIVTAIEAGFTALTKTLQTFQASPTATNLQAVQAAVNAVNQNVAQLESAAQIKDANSDAKVTAIVGLIAQLTAEIVAQVPATPAAAAVQAAAPASLKARGAKFWKGEYNKLVNGDSRFHALK